MKLPSLNHDKHTRNVLLLFLPLVYTFIGVSGYWLGAYLFGTSDHFTDTFRQVKLTLELVTSFALLAVVAWTCKLRTLDYWAAVNDLTTNNAFSIGDFCVDKLFRYYSPTVQHRKVLELVLSYLPVPTNAPYVKRVFEKKTYCKLYHPWQKEWWASTFKPVHF